MKALGILLLVLLTGCASTKEFPKKWPALKPAESLGQFAGNYSTLASASTDKRSQAYLNDDLGVFVAGISGDKSDTCRIVFSDDALWFERTSIQGAVKRFKLEAQLKDGVLALRHESHGSLDPLGVGGSKTRFFLYLTEEGSVVGRIGENVTALFLWVVPVIASDENWLLWKEAPIQTPEPK